MNDKLYLTSRQRGVTWVALLCTCNWTLMREVHVPYSQHRTGCNRVHLPTGRIWAWMQDGNAAPTSS